MFYKDLMLLNAILYQIKTIYAPQEGEQVVPMALINFKVIFFILY